MPGMDRLNVEGWRDDIPAFTDAIRTLGKIVAWGNLRTAARRGAAQPQELIDFGNRRGWHAPLIAQARVRARRTMTQWREFAK